MAPLLKLCIVNFWDGFSLESGFVILVIRASSALFRPRRRRATTTLFPYTTLFRSQCRKTQRARDAGRRLGAPVRLAADRRAMGPGAARVKIRSRLVRANNRRQWHLC